MKIKIMDKLSIIYRDANYDLRYEKKEHVPFRNKNEVIKWCRYSIYFDDPKLQEFGNPFEFTANIWGKIEITGIPENSEPWRIADAFLKALTQ
ncbi:MAG: hypothetical protein KA802_12515 [Saprospiraceae bacterium]|nr:hypothetical protein [Saprospiraceae bacterium]